MTHMLTKFPTFNLPHGKPQSGNRGCQSQDLIFVREGLQCSNCLALVVANKENGPNNPDRATALKWLAVNPKLVARWVENDLLMSARYYNNRLAVTPQVDRCNSSIR